MITLVAWLVSAVALAMIACFVWGFCRGLWYLLWAARQPVPPENLRIIRSDGTVVPLELRYTGKHGGIHHWETVTPARFVLGEDSLQADLLPGRSQITVQGWWPL